MSPSSSINTENFLDILLARKLGDKAALHEASLGRIMQHANDATRKGFAMLTSWRQNLDKKANIQRFVELREKVRGFGLGFNILNGHWQECQDPTVPYDQCPKDQLIDAVEPSLFITGISLKQAHTLGNLYDQDAIVFAGPETEGKVNLVFKDNTTMELGSFSPMTLSQAYSELPRHKGRHFHFEHFSWPTQGHTEALMEQSFRQKFLSHVIKEV